MYKKRVLALFVILQMAVSIMFPAPAFAWGDQPEVLTNWLMPNNKVVTGVGNRFDATLVLVGKWSAKIQINNDMYVKLSNPGSGGRFYELAQKFEQGLPLYDENNSIMAAFYNAIVSAGQAVAGNWAALVWNVDTTDEEIAGALQDLNTILNGGSLGSPGGGSGDYYEYEIKVRYVTSAFYTYFNDGLWNKVKTDGTVADGAALAPPTMYVKVPAAFIDAACTKLGSQFTGANTFIVYRRTSIGDPGSLSVIFSPTALNVGTNTGRFGDLQFDYYKVTYSPNKYVAITDSALIFSTYTLTPDFMDASLANRLTYSNNIDYSNPYQYQLVGVQSGGGSGGGGDNHWPEPTEPTPPEPNPTNPKPNPNPPSPPEIDLPDIDLPDPSVDLPITIVPPDNTTAADYTPWLRAILTALNTIIDDMGEHCDHIRVAMRDYLNGLYEALSDDLQAYYDDLTDYLSDLAKWIVSHLNFDIKQPDVNVNVPGYDDSSVIGWLRRIYYKLRGTGTPRPDPIEDTDGAFDWWSKFLEWITNALGGLLTDFVGDLGGFLQELIDTFPFSIPWDIVAMLTLLDAQRATPDVTFTIPGQNGWWNDITIRINLAAYDDAMATVRGMVLIWWMYILVMKTDWMMLLFDGANNAIGDFVSRLTGKG